MKINFIGHASILIETNGIQILSDPWWKLPCFGIQWWNYPKADTTPIDPEQIDYIYISHGHADHFHLPTLRQFSRKTKILIPKGSDMLRPLVQSGFITVEVAPNEEYSLGGSVTTRILPTHNDDSLMILTDGIRTCININDSLHSAPREVQLDFVDKIKLIAPNIDYFFCGYGTASHFPNCYKIPGKDDYKTAQIRQNHFSYQWAWLAAKIKPKYAFPFAADVALLEEELIWTNEAIHNCASPVSILNSNFTEFRNTAIHIAPGFEINGEIITNNKTKVKFDKMNLITSMSKEIILSRKYKTPDESLFDSTLELINNNINIQIKNLRHFNGDYNFIIKVRGSNNAYSISKKGDKIQAIKTCINNYKEIQPSIIATTRIEYLRASLLTKYGNEILFVGSGIYIEFCSLDNLKDNLQKNLQNQLRLIIANKITATHKTPYLMNLLRRIRKLLVRLNCKEGDTNLYDLSQWTLFK